MSPDIAAASALPALLGRERAILEFNRRVLAQARRVDVPLRDLEAVAAAAHALINDQYAAFNDEVMPLLQREGIVILNHADRDEAQRRWVDQFFQRQVRPLLVPVGLDPSHPFPQVANKSLNFIVRLTGRDAFGRENAIAIVKVPRVLPRVIKVTDKLAPGRQAFVLLTRLIRA